MNTLMIYAVLFVFGLAVDYLVHSILSRRESIDLDDLYELLESDIPLPRYKPNTMEPNGDYEIKSKVFEICSRKTVSGNNKNE